MLRLALLIMFQPRPETPDNQGSDDDEEGYIAGPAPGPAPVPVGRDNHTNIEHYIDRTRVIHTICRQAFDEVIQNSELFLAAFCHTITTLPPFIPALSHDIKFSLEESGIRITPKKPQSYENFQTTVRNFQTAIESIRNIFSEHLKNRTDFDVVVIPNTFNFVLQEQNPGKDQPSSEKILNINSSITNELIVPSIKSLSERLNFHVETLITLEDFSQTMSPSTQKESITFKIKWKDQEVVYPIPPETIENMTTAETKLYDLFLKHKFCDITLQAADGEVKIHATQLVSKGGAAFAAMLTSDMREAEEGKIQIQNFSLETVRAFVDFLYLGKIGSKSIENLTELLHFAHMYEVPSLVNYCTNRISLIATVDDLQEIKDISIELNNDHLKALAAHLSA